MKRTLAPLVLFVSAAMIVVISGCDKTATSAGGGSTIDTAASTAKAAQAYAEMENQFFAASTMEFKSPSDLDRVNFTSANQLYHEAVAANPDNPQANFGAALTEILSTYSDSTVRGMFTRWEQASPVPGGGSITRFGVPTGTEDMRVPTSLIAGNLIRILRVARQDPPTIGEMQAALRDRVLPRLDYALARLAAVEQHSDFTLRISGRMQGNTGLRAVYLDLTEVYLVDALIQGLHAFVNQFLIFRFDLPAYDTKSLVPALQPTNTSFFVLASDGRVRAQGVKGSLLAMVGKIRSAINFLKSQTGNMDDHVIKMGSGGIAQKDLDTTLSYLTRAENTLTGPFSVDLKNADSDGNNYTIQINIGAFFDNPPQNPKQEWFPAYTVDSTAFGEIAWRWTQQDYASFTFPDPTFSGIFPEMTNDELKRILWLDEEFGWSLTCSVSENSGALSPSTTAHLMINGKTYNPKQDASYPTSPYYRFFRFIVTDNPGHSVEVIVNPGSGDITLDVSPSLVVKPKVYSYLGADLTLAPQDISAQAFLNPPSVALDLKQYGQYVIERDSTGTFAAIDSVSSSYYQDFRVTSGKTYTYRGHCTPFMGFYYSGGEYYYGARPNNYTNSVTITVQ